MIELETTIINKLGLHARAASEFVRIAQKYGCEITVIREDLSANGKSIISMMMLQATKGTQISLRCEGEDEKEAIKALIDTIGNRFGEDE